jgi:iron complex outermembrane receptor protein
MKRTTLALAAVSLTQCLVIAAVAGIPLEALAQSRPNIQETMRPIPGRKNYAQDLVDRTVSRHPELIELDIHAVPPDGTESVIVAAKSRNRVGQRTDADDLAVFKSGEPRVEINQAGNNNVEVAVQLQDVAGRPVGSVEMTFPYVAGTDQEALVKKAE